MRICFSFAALIAMLAIASTARADLYISVSDGTNTVVYQGTGTSSVSTVGSTGTFGLGTSTYTNLNPVPSQQLVVTNASLGATAPGSAVDVSAQLAHSNSPGSPGLADLTANSLVINNNSGGSESLTITIAGNNFDPTQFLSSPEIKWDERLTLLTGSTSVSGTGAIDAGNHMPAVAGTPPLPTMTISSPGAIERSSFADPSVLGTTGFSLGEVISFTINAGDTVSLQMDVNVTPEPASLLAWGCGLGVIGLVRRRRRKDATA